MSRDLEASDQFCTDTRVYKAAAAPAELHRVAGAGLRKQQRVQAGQKLHIARELQLERLRR